MSAKKSLLEIVQEILSDMDSEAVNGISETIEAQQVASVVESTYFNIVSTRDIPEHYSLLKLTALSDSNFPTHFTIDDGVRQIENLWYDVSTDGSFEYSEIHWLEPIEFLHRSDRLSSDFTSVDDKTAGTKLRIRNDRRPSYFTSFDDYHVVMDSYDSTADTTLQNSKVRAWGKSIPTFTQSDSFVPDLDESMFPYLIAEAKSVCFSLFKGGVDQKVEQAARRQKSYVQNDLYKVKRANRRPHYGR